MDKFMFTCIWIILIFIGFSIKSIFGWFGVLVNIGMFTIGYLLAIWINKTSENIGKEKLK